MIAVDGTYAAALAAIHGAAFPPHAAWDARAMAEVLGMPGAFGWLDERGGLVLARHGGGEGEILTLAVAPAVRRLGIGRALLSRVLAGAAPPWFLEVAADNEAARALYAAAGFAPCGVRRGYFGAGVDALVLRWGV